MRFGGLQRSSLLLALAVIAADQASKIWLMEYLIGGPEGAAGGGFVELAPFANLVAVWNYGISFGIFNSGEASGVWMLTAVAALIVGVLLYWLGRTVSPFVAAALGLVIGGAVGNVIDRLRYGKVFDFLDIHLLGWHWPAFNLADAAITVGVALLFLDALFEGKRESK